MTTKTELAKQAYECWDTHGGRALGAWGGPYTQDAWEAVVGDIRAAVLEEAALALDEESEHLVEVSDREAFEHASDQLRRLAAKSADADSH